MNLPQRVIVYVTFVLLVLINFQTFSSMAYLFKGVNHFLPEDAVEVYLTDERSTPDGVPVRHRDGAPTGQAVEIVVHNSFYDRPRMLPLWNMGLLLLAFVAYGVCEVMKRWRARGAP